MRDLKIRECCSCPVERIRMAHLTVLSESVVVCRWIEPEADAGPCASSSSTSLLGAGSGNPLLLERLHPGRLVVTHLLHLHRRRELLTSNKLSYLSTGSVGLGSVGLRNLLHTFPESTTNRMPSMVTDVSAIFVLNIHLRTPSGATSNTCTLRNENKSCF